MVALFLDDKVTTKLTVTARRTAKNNIFILTKNNFACALHYFVHFFAPLRVYASRLFLHFLNLDNDRYGPKENFAKICQIKWNWIRLVKFEVVQIDF